VFLGRKSSRYQTDGPANVQPSDSQLSSQSSSQPGFIDETVRHRLTLLSLEDPVNYVPPLPSVSDQAHEKADMLIAYASVKGTLNNR